MNKATAARSCRLHDAQRFRRRRSQPEVRRDKTPLHGFCLYRARESGTVARMLHPLPRVDRNEPMFAAVIALLLILAAVAVSLAR